MIANVGEIQRCLKKADILEEKVEISDAKREHRWACLLGGDSVCRMGEGFANDELLEVPQIARYLRVSDVTVYRWCKEGRLPCLKLGHSWRVRRSALDAFLERGEQSATLLGQLRSFYRIPDNVLAIVPTEEALYRLDAAFLRVGEIRGGTLVKSRGPKTGASMEELRV